MTAGTILIVDDDVRRAGLLVELLTFEGFDAAHAPTGAVALARMSRRVFDLVILDVMTGKMDGLELLRCLRMQGQIPVLMLTRRGDREDEILSLDLGADDCLSKPFSSRELLAHMRAVLRRSGLRGRTAPTPLKLGELAIDARARSVTMEGVPVRLTAAEFMVLEALARSAGRVQSRAILTYQALGRRIEPFDRSIDTHVSNIRRKLCLDGGRGIEIRSFRRHGYVLTLPAVNDAKHLRPGATGETGRIPLPAATQQEVVEVSSEASCFPEVAVGPQKDRLRTFTESSQSNQ